MKRCRCETEREIELLFTPLRGENKIGRGKKKCIFRHSEVGWGGGRGKRMMGRRKKRRTKSRAKT
jgi:hypothetical protein